MRPPLPAEGTRPLRMTRDRPPHPVPIRGTTCRAHRGTRAAAFSPAPVASDIRIAMAGCPVQGAPGYQAPDGRNRSPRRPHPCPERHTTPIPGCHQTPARRPEHARRAGAGPLLALASMPPRAVSCAPRSASGRGTGQGGDMPFPGREADDAPRPRCGARRCCWPPRGVPHCACRGDRAPAPTRSRTAPARARTPLPEPGTVPDPRKRNRPRHGGRACKFGIADAEAAAATQARHAASADRLLRDRARPSLHEAGSG